MAMVRTPWSSPGGCGGSLARLESRCRRPVRINRGDNLRGDHLTAAKTLRHDWRTLYGGNSEVLLSLYGIMQFLSILLVRSRTVWCAGVGSPLAGDHRSQATFLLHDPGLRSA